MVTKKSLTKICYLYFVVVALVIHVGCINISVGGNLAIKNFHFASEISGSDDYVSHSNTYTDGEQVFMYFELEEFKKRDDDTAQIFQTLTVLTPLGIPFLYEGTPIQDYVMIDQAMDASGINVIWFDNHLPVVDETWITGTYNVEIVVEDRVANKDVSYTTHFIII